MLGCLRFSDRIAQISTNRRSSALGINATIHILCVRNCIPRTTHDLPNSGKHFGALMNQRANHPFGCVVLSPVRPVYEWLGAPSLPNVTRLVANARKKENCHHTNKRIARRTSQVNLCSFPLSERHELSKPTWVTNSLAVRQKQT